MYRQQLIEIYLNWFNNYCSIETFADHNGLYISEAENLLSLAKKVYNSAHPDK